MSWNVNLNYTVKTSPSTVDFLILSDLIGLFPTWTALSYLLYIIKVSLVMSNLNHVSDEICIFTFHSWALSHWYIFLQNQKKNLITHAALQWGYTMQVETQKIRGEGASLCIHGTNQTWTLSRLFSLLSALEIKSRSRFRFQVTGKHSRVLRLLINYFTG